MLLVDGIRQNPKILEDVKASNFPASEYEKILRAKTEEVFDTTVPWWIRIFPWLSKKYDNYFADIWALFRNKTARMAVCREVRSQIRILQAEGYEVDVLAYSLGTLIALTCASQANSEKTQVNHLSLYNSPLGFAVPFLGGKCRKFVRKYGKNFLANKIECIYGEKDLVSKNCKKKASGLLAHFSLDKIKFFATKEKHDLIANINAVY